jgi:hypothetical protein
MSAHFAYFRRADTPSVLDGLAMNNAPEAAVTAERVEEL